MDRYWNGAQGRNRTTDTRIFSPLLYRLSYLGLPSEGGLVEKPPRLVQRGAGEKRPRPVAEKNPGRRQRPGLRSIVLRHIAAGYLRCVAFIGDAARDHVIALEPAAEVDVGAALGAERPELGILRLAADGAPWRTLSRCRHRSLRYRIRRAAERPPAGRRGGQGRCAPRPHAPSASAPPGVRRYRDGLAGC